MSSRQIQRTTNRLDRCSHEAPPTIAKVAKPAKQKMPLEAHRIGTRYAVGVKRGSSGFAGMTPGAIDAAGIRRD